MRNFSLHQQASLKNAKCWYNQKYQQIFRFLNDFFIVGILEQFDDTLKLFEKLIPKFFQGAPHALVSEQVQGTTNLTKTKDKIRMSPTSREYLSTGPLKYEVSYLFLRALVLKV